MILQDPQRSRELQVCKLVQGGWLEKVNWSKLGFLRPYLLQFLSYENDYKINVTLYDIPNNFHVDIKSYVCLESHFIRWNIIGHFVCALVRRSTSKDHNFVNLLSSEGHPGFLINFKMFSPTFILWEMSNSTWKGVYQEETL